MRKRKIFLSVFLLLGLSLYVVFSHRYTAISFAEVHLEKELPEKEEAGFAFLLDKMQNENGLFYSWVEREQKSPDILLESMGQAVEYFALLEDRQLFEHYIKITNHYFISPKGYYYWLLDEQSKQGRHRVTAFLDDLRLAKAYFISLERDDKYEKELKALSGRIYKFNVDKSKTPVDFYDSKAKSKATELSLFYIDVETLRKLAAFDKKWQQPSLNAEKIILDMPENQFGLYPQKYQLAVKEYYWQDNVNMVENLYTALNAQNAGRDVTSFTNFLQLQIQQGHIYNYYNLTGTAESADESASVYALAARLFYQVGNYESAQWCYDKVQLFQIGENHSLQGGFGDATAGRVYAFNHLETMLMYRYLEPMLVNANNSNIFN